MRVLRDERSIAEAVTELIGIEPAFGPVAEFAGALPLRYSPPDYQGMAFVIVAQMISRASADAIWKRLVERVGHVEASTILRASPEELRSAGLSGAKTKALLALAATCESGLDLSHASTLPADDAQRLLTAVPGIGPWTAEVFLLFSAGHPDIFPAGDVALQNAAAWAFGLAEVPDTKRLRAISDSWRPLRSAAARLLWAYYGKRKGRIVQPV